MCEVNWVPCFHLYFLEEIKDSMKILLKTNLETFIYIYSFMTLWKVCSVETENILYLSETDIFFYKKAK